MSPSIRRFIHVCIKKLAHQKGDEKNGERKKPECNRPDEEKPTESTRKTEEKQSSQQNNTQSETDPEPINNADKTYCCKVSELGSHNTAI